MKNQHNAFVNLGTMPLPKNTGSGVSIEIFYDDQKLGEITIGKGSIRWKKRDDKSKQIYLNWSKFADLMNEIEKAGGINKTIKKIKAEK